MTIENSKHILGLNSLRLLAFLSIFLFHATSSFVYGYLGVDVFFVLSSFLLTTLALREIEATGRFDPIKFFMRRMLRIFPLYFLIIIFSFLILPWLGALLDVEVNVPSNPWYYVFFVSNFDASDHLFALKFLWSIAVEEQFYLGFLIIGMSLSTKWKWTSIIMLFLIYAGFMAWALQSSISTYSHTLYHLPNFGIGIVGALLFRSRHIQSIYVVPGLLVSSFMLMFIDQVEWLDPILFSLWTLFLIYFVTVIPTRLFETLLFKTTEELGRYTYGMYVYSGFVLTLFAVIDYPLSTSVKLSSSFLLILITSTLSFHLFERPFLKLKDRFRN